MSRTAADAASHAAAVGYVPFLETLADFLGARQGSDEPLGLIVIHLRNLHRINTSAGYRAGQELRRAFAVSVAAMLRDDDWMMPMTEDRLGLVLHRVRNSGHIMLAANRISRIASELPGIDGVNAKLDVVIGAAMFPEHGRSAEKLLRNSELAIESAALKGTGSAVFGGEISKLVTDNWGLEAALDAGIENGEFHLAYQPQVDAGTLAPLGAEALLRWDSERLGRVTPSEFIPIAEAGNRIDALTDFALHSAARDASAWPQAANDLTVAINLSPAVIEKGDIVAAFGRVAAIWGIGTHRLTAEVTESGIISTASAALKVLNDLRSAGVRVSIDDFGTGNSSLAYFKDIPADELKIDKSFVMAMLDQESNCRLVRTIIDLAHGFGLKVVAEGVESIECVERLQQFGCDVLQGHYFSMPLAQADFLRYLDRNGALSQWGQDTPSR